MKTQSIIPIEESGQVCSIYQIGTETGLMDVISQRFKPEFYGTLLCFYYLLLAKFRTRNEAQQHITT